MSDDASTTGPSASEAVAELLRQLVDARFVLTDRDGAVTRWSRPAEELFGWPAARMLGRSLVKTLGLRDSLPPGGGQLTTVAQRRDGRQLEVTLGLVPVRMNESLEFNGFLEALEFAAPRGDALAQLGRSHRTVVDWIHAALQGDAQLDDDGLAAGTIVTFRSLDEPADAAAPELEEDGLETDIERVLEDTAAELEETRETAEAARGEAAQAKERLTRLEQAEAGLESELASTRSVLDAIRTQVETLRGELEDTRAVGEEQSRADGERLRRELEAQGRLRVELDQVSEKVSALETAVSHERGLADRVNEIHARLSSFEGALAEVSGERGEDAHRLHAELAELRARMGGFAETAELEELVAVRDEEARLVLDGLRQELSALRSDALDRTNQEAGLAALAEQVRASVEAAQQAQAAIERLAGRAEEAATAANDDSASANDAAVAAEARATRAENAIEAVEAQAGRAQSAAAAAEGHADRARESSGTAEHHAGRAGEGAGAADLHAGRATEQAAEVEAHVRRMAEAADAAGRRAAEAQHAASSAVAAAELARRSAEEADRVTRAAEEAARGRGYEAPAALTRFRGRHTPSRANGNPSTGDRRPHRARKSEKPPQRARRPGFDDAGHPMATTELNGCFRELNQPFSELVGYSEEDFQAAVWPPVMDRASLPKHRQQMELLLEGRIDSAHFNTGYVHAQGLLVPLTGSITLVEEGGKPEHFLLSVDARS